MKLKYKNLYVPLFLSLSSFILSFNYIESLDLNRIDNLNYSKSKNQIKKLLSFDFKFGNDYLSDYKFTNDGIFLSYQKSGKLFLSFFDFASKNEKTIFSYHLKENEFGLSSWLCDKDFNSYLNNDYLSFYIFNLKNNVVFVDKKTHKVLKVLFIQNNTQYVFDQKIIPSKDKKSFYYIQYDFNKNFVYFNKLDLSSFTSKTINYRDMNKLSKSLKEDSEFFFKEDSNTTPFKIIESTIRNELIITNLDSIDIFDLKTLNYKKSIKIPKNYKLSPKNYILSKKENLIIFGKFDFEVSVVDLDKDNIDIFYEYKIDSDKGYDKYGEERIHFGTSQLQLSNDEKYLLEIGDDDRSHLFNFKTKELLETFWSDPFDDIKISDDSKYIIYSKRKDEETQKIKYDIKTQKNKVIEVIKNTEDKNITFLKNNFFIKTKSIYSEQPFYDDGNMKVYEINEVYLSNNKKEIPIYTSKNKISLYEQDFIYNQNKDIFGIFLHKKLDEQIITLELFSL